MVEQTTQQITDLETALNNFDPKTRADALTELASLVQHGAVALEPERPIANMHCHTFFSFNAYGHSPSSLAWLAKKRGFKLIGIIDFDVLDAVDEFLNACDLLGVRGSAGIETRMIIPEFSTREINSPGEPGVAYHIGIGFTSTSAPEPAASILSDLRQRAAKRNQGVIERVNGHLDPVKLDYEKDVLPLTPGGNPTERHICAAYASMAERTVKNPVEFWAAKLNTPADQIGKIIADPAKLQNMIRMKLMKQGGVGYVAPRPESFPALDDVHKLILACGALPCFGWLDGTSAGEQAVEELLNLLIAKGVAAVNIVPDRNWNISDPEVKRVKLQKLYQIVRLAESLDLPLNIGTEMNSYGNKLVDDFDAPELAPVRQAFIDGAHFIYGHTLLQRGYGLGYESQWAKTNFSTRRERNEFYTKIGYRATPGKTRIALDANLSPDQILTKIGQEK